MELVNQYITKLINDNSNQQLADIFRIIKHKRGFTYGPHAHDDIEINYVKRGTCTMRFDTGPVRFYENDCMILYPNAEHYFEVDRSNCTLVQIQFNLNKFPELEKSENHKDEFSFYYDVLTHHRRYIRIQDKKRIKHSIERIISEQQKRKQNYDLLAKLYFAELFLLLSREMSALLQANLVIDNQHLRKALAIFNSKYADDIDLKEVSAEIGISPRYLRKLFNDHMAISPLDYIISLRIAKAKELITNPAMSLKEIGYDAGFGNQAYFSRKFKQETGMSPMEYRIFCSD